MKYKREHEYLNLFLEENDGNWNLWHGVDQESISELNSVWIKSFGVVSKET